MKQTKYFVRILGSCWILYDILRILGMSHEMGIVFAIPVGMLLLTFYDDVETAKECRKQAKYKNIGGNSNGLSNASANIRHSSR